MKDNTLTKITALKKYLEAVRRSILTTDCAAKEFWLREDKKTSTKIESLTK